MFYAGRGCNGSLVSGSNGGEHSTIDAVHAAVVIREVCSALDGGAHTVCLSSAWAVLGGVSWFSGTPVER